MITMSCAIFLEIDIPVDDPDVQLSTTSSDDLGNLLIDDHLSDIVLRVGDRKFLVHRAILAARSPVFRAMFTSNMEESVAEEILIEDMEPDVMKELLRCVYTNQVPVECGCDMLIAFDRFGLISLFDRLSRQCHNNSRERSQGLCRSGRVERQTSEDEDTRVPEEPWDSQSTRDELNLREK